jgi:hypothetical protein
MFVNRTLMSLSEETEVEVLNATDKRSVFLMFAALSGEPLLTPDEYPECDEWVDWLTLGFSSSELEAYERDINRTGSQVMGFLFQMFFALEFTDSARLSSLIVRNIHFDPSALYGLFAVNCAKWTREVVRSAMIKFDKSMNTSITDGPAMFSSLRFIAMKRDRKFTKFTTFLDFWLSNGKWTDISDIEAAFTDHHGSIHSGRNSYASFRDEYEQPFSEDGEEADRAPEVAKPKPRRSPSARSRDDRIIQIVSDSRISCLNVNVKDDLVLLRQALILGGVYYSYCMLSFAKFWLQNDLITVDTEVARDRLTNAFLEDAFVKRLKLSPSATVGTLLKDIDAVKARVDQLWKSSGWTREELIGEDVARSRAVSPVNGSTR